ncbi:rhomboid family intramembrane serine protease [Halobacillus litoralis]|uniref:rhomboid family intramembrane serine protease n=1 Tax=Halobacillus litoralis TaxID=45668 RepID=UPI001CD46B91|nr:rhomboid family intramembrane serine protease [Halobacillus litoralis]MCA0970064.1 rhomboid family intramembrane serine protease [Halobacillus litoralis]
MKDEKDTVELENHSSDEEYREGTITDGETQKAPEHGDEREQVAETVDDHGRGPNQPVYGESYEEEYAEQAAVAPIHEPVVNREQETNMQDDVKVGMGWIGLSAAILSFFFAPLILGAAGIIFGVIGKRQGADSLGNMAIIVSVISILFSLFFTPIINFI